MWKILERFASGRTGPVIAARRSFFLKLGAGTSAALASASGLARSAAADADPLDRRLAVLEAEQKLRQLHQDWERLLDAGRYQDAIALFTADAQVVFNGGVFRNEGGGLARLFDERFRAGRSGGRMKPAPGIDLAGGLPRESLQVAPDARAATAVYPFSIRVGVPLESESSHVSMARLHGEGIRSWWEGGRYELTYVKDRRSDHWRISSLAYRTLARADYREGRSYAEPIAVAPFASVYPRDPVGPDRLV
jgi:hypothetical protein